MGLLKQSYDGVGRFFACFRKKGEGQSLLDNPGENDSPLSFQQKAACALKAVDAAKPPLALALAFWAFMVNSEDPEEKGEFITLAIGVLMYYEVGDTLQNASKMLSSKQAFDTCINALAFAKACMADVALGIAFKGDQPDLPPKIFTGVLAILSFAEGLCALKDPTTRWSHVLKGLLFGTASVSLGVGLVAGVATSALGIAGMTALCGIFAKKATEEYSKQKTELAPGSVPGLN